HEDIVYKTEREKFTAVIQEIIEFHERGQPVLVGTTSVEKSAAIARILKKKKIPHSVLNAKHHEREAYIVAQAGRKGSITVSTNMAGRGTDIILGGNPEMIAKLQFLEAGRLPEAEPEDFAKLVDDLEKECGDEHDEVVELGGLHIVGTERHESRRIDNQLRGRSGRQGDPGSTRFYLSLEDDLMRIFAGDRVKDLMDRMGMPDDEPIEHPWVSKSIENAQTKVETRNFDIRKNLLEYDDVMNAQRKTVYGIRQSLLAGRYEPEQLDELGKPTGRKRVIEPMDSMIEAVRPAVGQLIGLYLEEPIQPHDDEGKAREIDREQLASKKVVEHDQLRHEIYHLWGIVAEASRYDDGAALYDYVLELIPRGLTEQRERALDLIDRIISAMVEESCPPNRPPEDWDWQGIREGFEDHFGRQPVGAEDFGDQEMLAQELYKQAEQSFLDKEEELGQELLLRVFRHIYLEEIDKAWVDHLTNMDHLRDGIGLRGYGHRDPKQEYKREGYDMFVNMMAAVSANVVSKLFRVQVQRQEEAAQMEAEYAAKKAQQMLEAAARHGWNKAAEEPAAGAAGAGAAGPSEPAPAPQPKRKRIGPNDPCPCGSGKKFKKCHGSFSEDSTDV
ncbi:MAG: SEC-C metal-binding domain-containing protein, partial [Myxococcota bacterium]